MVVLISFQPCNSLCHFSCKTNEPCMRVYNYYHVTTETRSHWKILLPCYLSKILHLCPKRDEQLFLGRVLSNSYDKLLQGLLKFSDDRRSY